MRRRKKHGDWRGLLSGAEAVGNPRTGEHRRGRAVPPWRAEASPPRPKREKSGDGIHLLPINTISVPDLISLQF